MPCPCPSKYRNETQKAGLAPALASVGASVSSAVGDMASATKSASADPSDCYCRRRSVRPASGPRADRRRRLAAAGRVVAAGRVSTTRGVVVAHVAGHFRGCSSVDIVLAGAVVRGRARGLRNLLGLVRLCRRRRASSSATGWSLRRRRAARPPIMGPRRRCRRCLRQPAPPRRHRQRVVAGRVCGDGRIHRAAHVLDDGRRRILRGAARCSSPPGAS